MQYLIHGHKSISARHAPARYRQARSRSVKMAKSTLRKRRWICAPLRWGDKGEGWIARLTQAGLSAQTPTIRLELSRAAHEQP